MKDVINKTFALITPRSIPKQGIQAFIIFLYIGIINKTIKRLF